MILFGLYSAKIGIKNKLSKSLGRKISMTWAQIYPDPPCMFPKKGISRKAWADLQGGLGGLAGRPGRTKKELPLEIDVRFCTPPGIYQE